MASPIFDRFSLFLISTHSANLIYQALTGKKFKIWEDPFERDPPNVAP